MLKSADPALNDFFTRFTTDCCLFRLFLCLELRNIINQYLREEITSNESLRDAVNYWCQDEQKGIF